MSQLLLSSLAVVCPNCDGYNPPRAEDCASCGTALFETSATAKSSSGRATPASSTGKPASSIPLPKTPSGSFRTPEAPPGLRPASSRTPPPVSSAGGIPLATATRPLAAPASRVPVAGPGTPQPPARAPNPGGLPPTSAARPASAPRPAPTASRFGLVVVAGSTRGQRFKLPITGCTVGRTRGAILFPDDPFVSSQHATFLIKDNALHVRDESSASGIYVTIPNVEPLAPLSFFSLGQRLFRFLGKIEAPPPLAGRPTVYGAPVPPGQGVFGVEEILVGGRSGRAFVTSAPLLTIGQANCDFCYPQEDGLASRHCELSFTSTGAQLRDLSGGFGTYVRIPPGVDRPLRPGDRVRLGQHIVQVELVG